MPGSPIDPSLVERVFDLTTSNAKLLEDVRKEVQESKELQVELKVTIRSVSQTVEELRHIIFGSGDRESIPMLMQKLSLELNVLNDRDKQLEHAQEERTNQLQQSESRSSDRFYDFLYSLAPSALFGLLILTYIVMQAIYPDVMSNLRPAIKQPQQVEVKPVQPNAGP
jgi:hypothetical protein